MTVYARQMVIVASLFFCLLSARVYADDDEGRDWGFNCENPVEVFLKSPSDYPYISHKSTCGMNNDYSSTCLGDYDEGEDVIYKLEISYITLSPFRFTLDPMGSGWTGMVLSTECPDGGANFDDCLAYGVNDGFGPYYFEVHLPGPGTYYLMIDTWPAPDCIPEYELMIQMLYDKCWNANSVNLPEDAPYADLNQTTCGLYDFYNKTCMGYYDGGEEKLYKIWVDETAEYSFRLDPKGTLYAGIALANSDRCPPVDCIAFYSNTTGDKIQFKLTLEPQLYFLMIDTYPAPHCIPDYDLTINMVATPDVCGDANGDELVNVSDAVYIINFVFVGGLAPDPFQIADVNCDESVNISDAVFIINYIFIDGNSPCDTDGNGVPNC